MGKKVKLPIGIENFKEIRTENFYYVDKTGLTAELLNNSGKVNLVTNPHFKWGFARGPPRGL